MNRLPPKGGRDRESLRTAALISLVKSSQQLFSPLLRELVTDFHCFLFSHQEKSEDDSSRGKTQYSAQSGRIVPSSSKSYQRRSRPGGPVPPQHLQDQELMVPGEETPGPPKIKLHSWKCVIRGLEQNVSPHLRDAPHIKSSLPLILSCTLPCC